MKKVTLVSNPSKVVNPQIKVNAKWWNSLEPYEKKYFIERSASPYFSLSDVKLLLNQAKKQIPNIVKIEGKGFVTDKQGNTYLWNGNESKAFSIV